MTKLREQLIRIQRQNYRKNLKQVKESLGHDPAIDRYEREYKRYVKEYQEIADKAELIRKILKADVVYHGDYHTLRQSQRAILRVLREIQGKRDIILCMEMFHSDDQKYINQFLADALTETVFLKKIDYEKKWPFSWNNWGPIISFCKEKKIPILGINTPVSVGVKSLKKRDEHSARVVARTIVRHPDKLVYVVDGDYHISPNHLPKLVGNLLKHLDVAAKSVIIYQNAENLYWKLCKEGKEESDVLRISENSFCVMNTMPANKIQSYLNWLDFAEEAYYPVHTDWEDEGFDGKGITIEEMITTIASILDLKMPAGAVERLTVYYPSNLYFMDLINKIPELKRHIRLIKEKIQRDEGFLLEYSDSGQDTYIIYLANSSMNMAAEEAGHFVNAVLRGRLKKHLNPFGRFYRNVLTECLGFFGSKFINEKRKALSEYAVRRFIGEVKRGDHEDVDPVYLKAGQSILQHLYLQKRTEDKAEFMNKFHEAYREKSSLPTIFSTQLGYMLGNKLYYAVKKGKFPIVKIRDYFNEPFIEPGKAFECYIEISNRLRTIKTTPQY